MADIALVAAEIGALHGQTAEIIDVIAGATITKGQACYLDASGEAQLSNGGAAGTAEARGIALKGAVAGQVIPLLRKGAVEGFTVSGLSGDVPLYISDTAGALADGAGTVSKIAGIVYVLPDGNATKVTFIDLGWNT